MGKPCTMPLKCEYCQTYQTVLDQGKTHCPHCGAPYPDDLSNTYELIGAAIMAYLLLSK